jgi:hypothetical protein
LLQAEKERDAAIIASTPAVLPTPPVPQVQTPAESGLDTTKGTPTPLDSSPSEHSQRSEKLPDPDKFSGDKKDLRRFTMQIRQKMDVNADRYNTAKSRLAYVQGRLTGVAYAQVSPYIQNVAHQPSDYEGILDILEQAFGDPNRINNARTELFRLRQTNKDFASFFAEFHRLALEGEMSDDALSTILEQAVSKEVKELLISNKPPSRSYLNLAKHIQELENRRQYYSTTPAFRPYVAPTVKPAITTTTTTRLAPSDPMDLSSQRRLPPSDKETGNCFRCHKPGHRIRDCPHLDTRSKTLRLQNSYPAARLNNAHPTPISPPLSPVPQAATVPAAYVVTENDRHLE